ncbi:MAG: FecR domain-containing protein [Nitrospirae bacterium]|nr:FecR domain-containing protein [Nitrospirota bacterium]
MKPDMPDIIKMPLMSLLFCFIIISSSALSAAEDEIIGEVKRIKGTAAITHDGSTSGAVIGSKIYRRAVLTTSKKSSLSFTLQDGTVFSMGSDSVLSVESFVFVPIDKKLSLLAKVSKGSASYTSGSIGRLAPDKVKIETPDMSIGIRGTYFLVRVSK